MCYIPAGLFYNILIKDTKNTICVVSVLKTCNVSNKLFCAWDDFIPSAVFIEEMPTYRNA